MFRSGHSFCIKLSHVLVQIYIYIYYIFYFGRYFKKTLVATLASSFFNIKSIKYKYNMK